MRRLFLALALILAPALALAQTISVSCSGGGGGTAIFSDGSEVITLGCTPGANDLVKMWVGGATATVSSMSGLGGTWTQAVSQNTAGAGQSVIFGTRNGTGSGNQVTITMSGNDASANVRYAYIVATQSGGAGFDAVTEHTNSNGANGANSPHASGSTTPTDANNICFGGLKGSSGTYSAIPGGWTSITIVDTARGRAGYIIQTSATAQDFSVTGDSPEDRNVVIACVDSPAGGGGGGGTPQRRSLLRVGP